MKQLKPGKNEMTLLCDTEHHGVEILLPGPVIIVRYKWDTCPCDKPKGSDL